MLAHSGAPYEISDFLEIYVAGRRHSADSSRDAPRVGGQSPRPTRSCAQRPCASKFSGNLRRSLFGTGLSQNGTCLGGGIGSKIRAREEYRDIFSVWEDQSLCTPDSLPRVKEWVVRGKNCSKQSYHGAILIEKSCMHVCFGVDSRLGSSSAQRKAPINTPRSTARPTQDTARGGTEGIERKRSDGNTRRYHCIEKADLEEKFPTFNNMYCCCIAVRVWTLSTAAVGKTKNRL